MWKARRQPVSRVLTACCAVLCFAGSLHVGSGKFTPQWTTTHCPQGQTQHSPVSHNHCAWHCAGLDTLSGGGRGEISIDIHLSRVWSLGVIPFQGAVSDGEFPPRGPPQAVLHVA